MGYCMHVLAGPHVEHCWDPETFNPAFSQNDLIQVAQVLARVEPSVAKRKILFNTSRRRLLKLVDLEWDKIGRVSYALYCKGTVFSAELDALIFADELREAA